MATRASASSSCSVRRQVRKRRARIGVRSRVRVQWRVRVAVAGWERTRVDKGLKEREAAEQLGVAARRDRRRGLGGSKPTARCVSHRRGDGGIWCTQLQYLIERRYSAARSKCSAGSAKSANRPSVAGYTATLHDSVSTTLG